MTGRMNYSGVSRGTAMRNHRIGWKIRPQGRGGITGILETSDIPKVRKLLRSTMSLAEIGAELGVCAATLRTFIKRRSICNINERRKFIELQRSLAKLPEPTA